MKKNNLQIKNILFGCLFFSFNATGQQEPWPGKLTGNWLTTEGNNQFVLGVYKQVICYDNETWKIVASEKNNNGWKLDLTAPGKKIQLEIYPKDEHSITISGNNRQLELKNTRTYNYKNKSPEQTLLQPFSGNEQATVKGYIHLPPSFNAKQGEDYIQVSYRNELTGQQEYFFSDIDSSGSFKISFPVYRSRMCNLYWNGSTITDFFIQPGHTLLVAFNKAINIKNENPDYDKLAQRVCMMGTDGDFNNQYLHYLQYCNSAGFPQFNFPVQIIKGKTVQEKKEIQFAYYDKLYKDAFTVIDHLYAPGKAGRQFIEYIKEEIRYKCAAALMANLHDEYGEKTYREYKVDSNDLARIHKLFLEEKSAYSLSQDAFYELAGKLADKIIEVKTGNRFSYTISQEKIDQRVEKDYGPLLSNDFLDKYRQIRKDWHLLSGMKDEEIFEQYFNGSREEATNFRYLVNAIGNEFYKEARDSANYTLYRRHIPNPRLRFAANVYQLTYESNRTSDISVPSVYRIKLFNEHSRLQQTPWQLVDSINMANTIGHAMAGISVRINQSLVKEVNNEKDWQIVLKELRGKVVVVWLFSHYYQDEFAYRSLYEFKKIKEKYRDKNVVFIKGIVQRERSDRVKQLMNYLGLMGKYDELNDLYYIDRSISLGGLMRESIGRNCMIYNEQGFAHHPEYYLNKRSERQKEEYTLEWQLNKVLAGNGGYYEAITSELIKSGSARHHAYIESVNSATWTLMTANGNYYTYTAREPDKPIYGKETDTVFKQVTFFQDSLFVEHSMILHRRVSRKRESFLQDINYEKEFKPGNGLYQFRIDNKERTIILKAEKGELVKKYKVLTISPDVMVLELIE